MFEGNNKNNFEKIITYGPVFGQIMLAETNDEILEPAEWSEHQNIIKNKELTESIEKVKIIKTDSSQYQYYIDFIKNKKPKISHLSSSISYLPIFDFIKENNLIKNKFYIGKPHGFYSIVFAFRDKKDYIENYFKYIVHLLNGNGVLSKNNILNFFDTKNLNTLDFINNIEYIAETMGSALGVAQGAALINNDPKYVIMSDAEIEMGEFYECLLMQKKFNFNITLLIDYNGTSKQNKTIISIDELRDLLKMFNQSAIIFDNRKLKLI